MNVITQQYRQIPCDLILQTRQWLSLEFILLKKGKPVVNQLNNLSTDKSATTKTSLVKSTLVALVLVTVP